MGMCVYPSSGLNASGEHVTELRVEAHVCGARRWIIGKVPLQCSVVLHNVPIAAGDDANQHHLHWNDYT